MVSGVGAELAAETGVLGNVYDGLWVSRGVQRNRRDQIR